jgi:hypothetical protein
MGCWLVARAEPSRPPQGVNALEPARHWFLLGVFKTRLSKRLDMVDDRQRIGLDDPLSRPRVLERYRMKCGHQSERLSFGENPLYCQFSTGPQLAQ